MGVATEADIRRRAARLYEAAAATTPRLLDRKWWTGRLLEWAIRDEAFKVQLFRFIDVLPTLKTPSQIKRLVDEYLGQDSGLRDAPGGRSLMRWGMRESWPKYSSTSRLIWDGVFRVGRTSMKRKSWTLKASSRMAHSRSRPVHHLRSRRRGVVAAAASYSRAARRRMSASVAKPMASDPFNLHYTPRLGAALFLNSLEMLG